MLATELYALSATDASRNKKQASSFVLAGIPLLFSSLRALLIECNARMYGFEMSAAVLTRLAKEQNELSLLREHYTLNATLAEELARLYEVRNEAIHPAHRPSGTLDYTPEYLRPLKALGVLVSTGDPRSDFTWMHQLQSHALFRFSFSRVEQVVEAILAYHEAQDPHFECRNLQTYQRYKSFEVAR
jgi:UDP-N-acetyl-D-mannosaminuronic acid transferase (WecB/TagA/CpsF family)